MCFCCGLSSSGSQIVIIFIICIKWGGRFWLETVLNGFTTNRAVEAAMKLTASIEIHCSVVHDHSKEEDHTELLMK